jgi:hypothetical protein
MLNTNIFIELSYNEIIKIINKICNIIIDNNKKSVITHGVFYDDPVDTYEHIAKCCKIFKTFMTDTVIVIYYLLKINKFIPVNQTSFKKIFMMSCVLANKYSNEYDIRLIDFKKKYNLDMHIAKFVQLEKSYLSIISYDLYVSDVNYKYILKIFESYV